MRGRTPGSSSLGDVTQVDLPRREDGSARLAGTRSHAGSLDIPGIGIVTLDRTDIVRHPLVQAIVNAYEDTPETAPAAAVPTAAWRPPHPPRDEARVPGHPSPGPEPCRRRRGASRCGAGFRPLTAQSETFLP